MTIAVITTMDIRPIVPYCFSLTDTYMADVPFEFLRFLVPHRVLKTAQSDPGTD